jgi:hypothetical protein
MSDFSSTRKETFCIPICRKSLPVPGIRHFKLLPAIKVWPLEGDLAWLQGPEFSGMGNVKGLIPGPEDFSGMGTGKTPN